MDTRLDAGKGRCGRVWPADLVLVWMIAVGSRIHGPDFMGGGHPFGALVDAHYYSNRAGRGDLRTMVHVLEDGETQVYFVAFCMMARQSTVC